MHKDNEKKQFEVRSTLQIFGVQKYAEIDTLINELEGYCFSNRSGYNKKDDTFLNFPLYFESAIEHLELSQRVDVLKHLYNVSLNSNWNGAKAQKALFEYIEYAENDYLGMKEFNEYSYNEMLIEEFNEPFQLNDIDTVFPKLKQSKCYNAIHNLNEEFWREKNNLMYDFEKRLNEFCKDFSLIETLYILKGVYNTFNNKALHSIQCLKAYILELEKTGISTPVTPFYATPEFGKMVVNFNNKTPTQENINKTPKTPLEEFFTTFDKKFNEIAKNWFFKFSVIDKSITDKPFIDLISVFQECYNFIFNDINITAFACVDKINEVFLSKNLTTNERVLLLDKITDNIHTEFIDNDRLEMISVLLWNCRVALKPIHAEIPEFKPEFVFEDILTHLNAIESKQEKLVYLTNTIADFKNHTFEMNEIDYYHYQTNCFLDKVKNELDRVTKLIEIAKTTPIKPIIVPEMDLQVSVNDIFKDKELTKKEKLATTPTPTPAIPLQNSLITDNATLFQMVATLLAKGVFAIHLENILDNSNSTDKEQLKSFIIKEKDRFISDRLAQFELIKEKTFDFDFEIDKHKNDIYTQIINNERYYTDFNSKYPQNLNIIKVYHLWAYAEFYVLFQNSQTPAITTQETPSKVVISKNEHNYTPIQEVPTSTQKTPANTPIQKPKKEKTAVRKVIFAYYLVDAMILEFSKSTIKERFGIATYNKYSEYSKKRITHYLEITKSVAENELKEHPKAQKTALEDINKALLKLKY